MCQARLFTYKYPNPTIRQWGGISGEDFAPLTIINASNFKSVSLFHIYIYIYISCGY